MTRADRQKRTGRDGRWRRERGRVVFPRQLLRKRVRYAFVCTWLQPSRVLHPARRSPYTSTDDAPSTGRLQPLRTRCQGRCSHFALSTCRYGPVCAANCQGEHELSVGDLSGRRWCCYAHVSVSVQTGGRRRQQQPKRRLREGDRTADFGGEKG